ncbi:DUF885 domain-containing protein [Enemella sp. A6]|uniref:DUF885 domain-containing protein n=1 Tax=Enemella sp. A6 TaxID=3440152 RepID=UPI003EC0154F
MSRPESAVDRVANQYVRELSALSPGVRIALGHPDPPGAPLLDDHSPDGAARRNDLAVDTLRELDTVEAVDEVDRVTMDAMHERLEVAVESHEWGLHLGDVNVIASALPEIRDTFELVPTDTIGDLESLANRLAEVPTAIEGHFEAIAAGLAIGRRPAERQVRKVAEQAHAAASDDGALARRLTEITGNHPGLPDTLATRLAEQTAVARRAFGAAGDRLLTEVLDGARAEDACGRDEYQLASRRFLGTSVDLDETYEWGLDLLRGIIDEQQQVAREITGSPDIDAAIAALDADPALKLHGTEALQQWMQQLGDAAIAALDGTHFDIPEPLHRLEARISTSGTGGIYYTGPSDDFTRPGRMWWAVPAGSTEFTTWRETTTVYHEGVPGHHLQVGYATAQSGELNDWRRNLCWTSGHGEGWALYAERLMADLGFLDHPGDRMGMLDAQRLRAARVVLDIGVHLGKPMPEPFAGGTWTGGGVWDAEQAWEFLNSQVSMDEPVLRFELDRYLGWPGQAPSYSVGQRVWEQIRDEARALAESRAGRFSAKAFHTRALKLGGLGLDTLRRALAPGP